MVKDTMCSHANGTFAHGHGRWIQRETGARMDNGYGKTCTRRNVHHVLRLVGGPASQGVPNAHRFFESGENDHYGWLPRGCTAEPPLRSLANLLRKGTLTIVGDSIAGQQFLSLLCMFRDPSINASASADTLFALRSANGQISRVRFERSDFLVSARSALVPRAADDSGPLTFKILESDDVLHTGALGDPDRRVDESWYTRLRMGPSSVDDVLVLSSGPHWVGNMLLRNLPDKRARAAYRTMANTVLAHIKASDFRGRIFYRMNYAPGCSASPVPNRSLTLPPEAPNGWSRLTAVDEAWAASADKWQLPRFWFLHVSRMSSERTDRHVGSHLGVHRMRYEPGGNSSEVLLSNRMDCLHFSLPGPPDAWNLLLLDALAATDGKA